MRQRSLAFRAAVDCDVLQADDVGECRWHAGGISDRAANGFANATEAQAFENIRSLLRCKADEDLLRARVRSRLDAIRRHVGVRQQQGASCIHARQRRCIGGGIQFHLVADGAGVIDPVSDGANEGNQQNSHHQSDVAAFVCLQLLKLVK